MSRRNPFKHHRFPNEIILMAVRWYCRYPLSYRDVRDRHRKLNLTGPMSFPHPEAILL